MRPVQLQMSGLQSYRELQTIDFSRLIDAGVFGIFGPTGSGKSSILDAITLALYGKVERASGGTQAIMNHAETTLFVSFTFELTNAAGSARYKVERQFKRGTELSINGTIARLVRIADGETVVLADKAGEVNQQVQHILGLSMQDFTRAVVLPQGKFAEFLTLTGKDRRQMLQRLFHLESYGDQLSQKVSSRVKETDSSVKQLAAEQQGLGDASAQALEDAKRKLEEAEQAEAQSRLRVVEQERVYEEHKLIHGWQSEAEGLEDQQRKLQESELSIKEKEGLLQIAEKAQQVQPFLAQHDLAVKEIAAAEAKQLETTDALKQAEQAYSGAAQAAEQAQQELSAQEGPLLLRLDQLEQALVLAQELSGLQQQMQAVTAQREEAGDAWGKVQAEISKAQETKQKALAKQADLKAQLGGIGTSAATRQMLQAAVQAKRAIEQQNEQKLEAESHQAAKQMAFEDVLVREAAFGGKQDAWGRRLFSWRSEAVSARERMQSGLAALSRLLSGFQAWLDEERKRWKQQERHALAELLASELRDGEPCPVCGSTDHNPVKVGVTAQLPAVSREDELQLAEQLLLQVREGQYSGAQLDRKQEALWQEAIALGMRWENKVDASTAGYELLARREAAAGLADLLEASVNGEPEAEIASVAAWQRVWQAVELDLGDLSSAWEQLEDTFGELQRVQRALEQEAVLLQAQKETALAALEEAKAKTLRIRVSLEAQRSEWTRTYAGLDWQQADQQLEELLANERLAEELRGRIEKSVPFLEELQANLEALQRTAQEQDRLALQLDERLQGLAQLAADKTRQLKARAGGADVAQLIAEATAALERLRQRAQTTKLAHADAQAAQSQAAQRASAAAEAAAAAERQLAQAERALRAALEASGFASREAAAAAALAPEQRRAWALLAAEHREREQALRAQLAQLAAKLQGRSLSAADWAQSQERLRAAKAAAEAALEARAAAAQGASELAVRHARWGELEAQRVELAAQLERLGKLQAVLKANAFVEYLAEEQLMQVSRAASERLGELTRRRYGIEVDSGGGFVIRDDANGGVKRPVSTLSGGETFLTSLALALALSAQIQLKGEYPLEFFFLDEGFGTLDQELLDMVIGALEKLHTDKLAVGVISHVPELRARLVRKLIVQPAESSGRGSRIVVEEV